MSQTHELEHGTTNGATAVDVASAPASGRQRIIPAKGFNLYNADSGALAVTLRLNDNGTIRIIKKDAALAAGASFQNDGPIVLDATTTKLQVVLGGAVAATEPDWVCSFIDHG